MPQATSYTALDRQEAKAILLLEGVDDWHCFTHLLGKLFPCYKTHFVLADCGNREAVFKALRAESIASQPMQRVGAIIDADKSTITSVLQSVSDSLGSEYSLPTSWPNNGLIAEPKTDAGSARSPRIGIWCMPDNQTQGIFEDLLNRAMPNTSRQFIEETIEKALEAKHAKHSPVESPKAILRTYMAWNAPTCSKYGEALGQKLFVEASLREHFQPMIDWARRLFAQ